jgi:uncharacterized protein (DUF2062 family)
MAKAIQTWSGIVMSSGGEASIMKDGFLYRRVVAPIVTLLTQGITPEKIALSLAFGIVLGIFPVLGSTTVLCVVAAWTFQLNLPAIQVVNYLIYPLQLFLLVPFLRMGEKLFRVAPMPLSLTQILSMVRTDPAHAISALWLTEVHAMSAWLLIGLPAIFSIYFLLSRILRQVAAASGPLT